MSDQITVLEIWRANEHHSIYVFRGHLEESELKPFIKQWCKDMFDDPEPDPNDSATEWYHEVIQQEFFKPINEESEPVKKSEMISAYPFNEGDDYWTIEKVVSYRDQDKYIVMKSCWDDLSVEYYDENPYQVYYRTEDEAKTALEEGAEKVYCTNGTLV